jgi:hypothetical protein
MTVSEKKNAQVSPGPDCFWDIPRGRKATEHGDVGRTGGRTKGGNETNE